MKSSNFLIAVMIFSLTALCLLFSTRGFAQPNMPNNKLYDVVNDFFTLYNNGDTAAYRKFLEPVAESQVQLEKVLTGFKNAYRVIGKVEVRKVQFNSPYEAEVWAQDNQHDAWWKFAIHTDSFQHFKNRTIMPIPFESYFIKSGTLSTQELRNNIDQYIANKLSGDFSGNVLIAKGNELVYAKSFGTNANSEPNQFDQQFDLASMGKMFTAISILQLRDQGVLSLDDKAGTYLSLKNKAVANVTIKQLLTHTSGMGDFFESPMYEKLKDSLRSPADFMPFFEAEKLGFEPGNGWQYSNTGFCLLSLIVERLTHERFERYVRENIFAKAYMSNSVVGGGAGGGLSTVNDLHKFSIALLRNDLLSEKTTKELFQYTVNGKYGYGTEHQVLANENIVGHSGGFINVCDELNIYTKSEYIVIILSNSNPPFGHFLSNKIKELLVRK